MTWTHPIRIYRPGFDQKHDLSPEMVSRDIYNEDVWGRLMPDNESLAIPNELGFTPQSAQVALPKDVDASVGYVLFVGTPRVRDGEREMTETTLTDDAIVGQTILSVRYSGGFLPGQKISLEDETNTHYGKIKTVERRELTLYTEDKLQYDFANGTPIRVGTYFTVVGRRYPADYGSVQLLNVTETGGALD